MPHKTTLNYFKNVIAPRNLRIALNQLNESKTDSEKDNLRKYIRYLRNVINSEIDRLSINQ